jgi:hypothetical protein
MALGLVDGIIARGKALDDKLSAFVDEFQLLRRDFRELERYDYPPSSWALVENNLKAAVAARLMSTPMQTDFLPPHRRHSIEHVVGAWGDSVKLRAEARLRGEAPLKAPPVASPPDQSQPAGKTKPKSAGGIGQPWRGATT